MLQILRVHGALNHGVGRRGLSSVKTGRVATSLLYSRYMYLQ